MVERVKVSKGSYHDSAFLMRLARQLKELPGVREAVVLMGTDMNRELLSSAGFEDPVLEEAGPMDLVVALRADDQDQLEAAADELEQLMKSATSGAAGGSAGRNFASLDQAIAEQPSANLVSVAVPGQYAAYVAGRALDAGRHVFLFSNNVELEDELALKMRARDLGLLMMGPDCGTAILAGVGLGFANRVRRGRIGLVGASGTGIQEISSLVHNAGGGISQAIGTGSRDLSADVDGMMSEFGLKLLASDPDTKVIVLVAKPPAEVVAERLHGVLTGLFKPVVVRYLGQTEGHQRDGVLYTSSLDEAAHEAVVKARGAAQSDPDPFSGLDDVACDMLGEGGCVEGRLVGLFGGGSLTTEAATILRKTGLEVEVPEEPLSTTGPVEGSGHLVVDTGEDFYTVGKPHPMVDQTVRCDLIRKAGADPGVRLILLDLVLGDGAHSDPAPELVQATTEARAARGKAPLTVIASVTGTELDPQGAERQRQTLARGGFQVLSSAARAAGLAAALLGGKLPGRTS